MFDLSKDSEAQVANSDTFSSRNLAVERVITKVLTKYAIPLDISDSIRSTFRTKLWRLGKTFSSLGGTKRKQQLKAWEETIWSFSVDPVEVSVSKA